MERLIGKQAPYFSMEALSADGEHFVRVALPDYAGKWLVLFFYPMDFTFLSVPQSSQPSQSTGRPSVRPERSCSA